MSGCTHRMFNEPDGQPCSLAAGHDGGHVAESGSFVPDRHDATSGGEH